MQVLKHVLVLGARAPACLEWARAFRAAGWRVTVADSLHWPLARASRSAHGFLRLPEPRREPARWIDALAQAVRERGIDLVLPTCEEVFYLAHGRARIPCRVLTSGFELLHRLHHKGWFADMTRGWPVQAPATRLLRSAQDLEPLRATSRDWVFKPAYSRFASRTLIRPAPQRLAGVQPSEAQPWVAQRFVAGREHCSYSLLVDGRLTAHTCYHPRYRVGRGSGIWFEPTDPAPVRALVERFGAETGYTGQVAFDLIEAADGSCQVIECNPRATSGVHLLGHQPAALVAALLGEAPALLVSDGQPRAVALAMLLFGAPRHGLRRHFWRDFRQASDVVTRPGDRALLAAQGLGLAEVAGRALARRIGLLQAATADIEWDGQALDSTA
jgi:hypothetical protein